MPSLLRLRGLHAQLVADELEGGGDGLVGRTSTTGTRTRSEWINGLKRMFYQDTLFVL